MWSSPYFHRRMHVHLSLRDSLTPGIEEQTDRQSWGTEGNPNYFEGHILVKQSSRSHPSIHRSRFLLLFKNPPPSLSSSSREKKREEEEYKKNTTFFRGRRLNETGNNQPCSHTTASEMRPKPFFFFFLPWQFCRLSICGRTRNRRTGRRQTDRQTFQAGNGNSLFTLLVHGSSELDPARAAYVGRKICQNTFVRIYVRIVLPICSTSYQKTPYFWKPVSKLQLLRTSTCASADGDIYY